MFGHLNSTTYAIGVFYNHAIARRTVAHCDFIPRPPLWDARVDVKFSALQAHTQNAFDAGPLHPSRCARIPSPASPSDMLGSCINVSRDDIRFNFIAMYVGTGTSVIDRV